MFSFRLSTSTLSLLHHHRHTTSPTHYRHTTDTPPTHYRHTTDTPPTHHRHTTDTLPTHYRHTTDTLPTHRTDTLPTHRSKYLPNVYLVISQRFSCVWFVSLILLCFEFPDISLFGTSCRQKFFTARTISPGIVICFCYGILPAFSCSGFSSTLFVLLFLDVLLNKLI